MSHANTDSALYDEVMRLFELRERLANWTGKYSKKGSKSEWITKIDHILHWALIALIDGWHAGDAWEDTCGEDV